MRRLLAFTGVALLSAALGGLLVAYLLPKPIDRPSPFHRPTPTELALERAVPELNIQPMPLEAALDKLSETWGIEVTGNWTSLEETEFDQKAEVKLRARDVTLEEALDFLLRQLQSDAFSLAYSVQRAGIVVDSRDAVKAESCVRMYELADLLRRPDLVAFYSDHPSTICVEGGDLFGGSSSSSDTRDVLIQHLQETIDADIWRDNGGSIGTARWLGSRLVVTQTESNHREIEKLFAKFRQDLTPTEATPDAGPRLRVWDDRVMRFVYPQPEHLRWSLHHRIGRFSIEQKPIRTAIGLLAEQSAAPIFLDMDALEKLDFDLARPVTVHFPDATLYQALRAILKTPSPDGPVVGLDEGVIVITSREEMSEEDLERAYTQTRVFDISDFVQTRDQTERGRAEFIEQLVGTIQEKVDTSGWRDNGGGTGAIAEVNGRLIVTQTPENIRHVRQLLQELLEHPEKIGKPASDNPASAPSPDAQ